MGFIGVRLSSRGKDCVSSGCGTYSIEDNTIQYSAAVIIYYNTLQPMFSPKPFNCS